MDREELFAFLDIDDGSDFQYFENFADLVESDGQISEEAVYELVEELDLKVFAELCESYFYDLLENIPDDQIDLYNLLETIKRVLVGAAEGARQGEENARRKLAEELDRFRLWYSAETNGQCKNLQSGEIFFLSVRDALANARLARFSGEEWEYDFSDALDYELDEYTMTYSDLYEE